MATINGYSYRGISRGTAEHIGMAASVAGGYVAINGPGIERRSDEWMADRQEQCHQAGEDTAWVNEWEQLQGGDWARIDEMGRDYVLVVPADGPLASEGYSLPANLVERAIPRLREVGYEILATA